MSTGDVIPSAGKTLGAGLSSGKSAAGGAGGIEIVGFPQVLYSRNFGDPDILFVPLLDAARDAHLMMERLASHGEDRANAVMLSGMHLASCLLREPSFSLAARGLPQEHTYTVALDAGTLHVNTRLYAVVSRRTSSFRVEIFGKIAGGTFEVRNPIEGSVIMRVEEERLRQPNAFSLSLAEECLREQMDQERTARIDGPEKGEEVRFMVCVAGANIPVLLRRKEEGDTWDIVDGRRQEWVGALAPEMAAHLKTVTTYIAELFSKK